MVENVGRKILLTLFLLAISVGLLLVKDPAFNLGLDLQGGTRLVYSFDFEQAIDEGSISRNENQGEILRQTIEIIRNRVDPTGTLDAIIRAEGEDSIVIELPGKLGLSQTVSATLAEELPSGWTGGLLLEQGAAVGEFPISGGTIRLRVAGSGDAFEDVRYEQRLGNELRGLSRGVDGTRDTAHAAGANAELISDDAIKRKIENLGELAFLIVAENSHFVDLGTDLATEQQRLRDWYAENPGAQVQDFNRVPPDQGGPHERIWWFENGRNVGGLQSSVVLDPEAGLAATPVMRPATPEDSFRGDDLAQVFPSSDELGYPAVGFEMSRGRRADFGAFTSENVNKSMAIVLNGVVDSAPTINSRLPGSGIIQGRYTEDQVKDLITVLRSGSLKIRPTLEHEEKVGATLGQDYVEKGFLSGVLALVLVIVFMIVYYRLLGIFSAVALGVSFVLLLGGMSFMQATLTLPGIAGIILTVGMAVDANILIFDRIREEIDKGRNAKQGAKTGFDMARSAILDSNITTFLTAVILYSLGTGPVRGFAVTLMIGIVTSVFAAMVVTRVLVHIALQRGVKEFKVGRWMVTADYAFLRFAKPALALSAVLIVGSLALFVALPNKEKLGIDFLGGSELQLRTEQVMTIDDMRARVGQIPGVGGDAEVKPILGSASGDGYTEFRAMFKIAQEEDLGEERLFESQVRRALADVLLANPVQATVRQEGSETLAEVRLIFEDPHTVEDVAGRLSAAGLREPEVELAPERANAFVATAATSAGRTPDQVVAAIEEALRGAVDSTGKGYQVAEAIPSSTTVGPQVVGQLRDDALLAIAVSLFMVVMYIRVRFAEYSYGFAAVAALAHDVVVTLGALMVANHFGIVNGELSLPMIAAFLTIIGYSLNDTIIIFDRVRENLPRMKVPLAQVLNTSVNQTLSRTILTSLTTFVAVLIMYAVNFGTGNVMESFSFAMGVGIVTGTYSTVYIANPILLWLEARNARTATARGLGRGKGKGESDPTFAS